MDLQTPRKESLVNFGISLLFLSGSLGLYQFLAKEPGPFGATFSIIAFLVILFGYFSLHFLVRATLKYIAQHNVKKGTAIDFAIVLVIAALLVFLYLVIN